jgi:hypothetical protein
VLDSFLFGREQRSATLDRRQIGRKTATSSQRHGSTTGQEAKCWTDHALLVDPAHLASALMLSAIPRPSPKHQPVYVVKLGRARLYEQAKSPKSPISDMSKTGHGVLAWVVPAARSVIEAAAYHEPPSRQAMGFTLFAWLGPPKATSPVRVYCLPCPLSDMAN